MKKTKLVAKAALLNENGQFLILTRSGTDKIRPGDLDLPGGSVEQDENYEEAVIREIQEEAGLSLSKDEVFLVFTNTSYYEDRSTIRFLYVGHLKRTPDITLSYEHSNYAWMTLEEVAKEFSHPVWVEGLKYAAAHDLLPHG